MARSRFVLPNTIRLDLSEGDWIEVKERLTYGEQQRLAGGAMARATGMGSESVGVDLDFERYNLLRVTTWLVDWSFVDPKDKQVPVSREAVAALDPDTMVEIDAALTAHIEALEASKNRKPSPGSDTSSS
jgi:hypothetical protein